jgi:hypothetical protein
LINAAEVGKAGAEAPEHADHIRVHNVLFVDIGSPEWGSGGKLFRSSNNVQALSGP